MTATQAPNRATPSRHPIQRRYRLLHSSGDHLITDRPTALRTLAALPGAKLFVLRERGGEAQKGGQPPFTLRRFLGSALAGDGGHVSDLALAPREETHAIRCPICKNGETRPGTATLTLERGALTMVVRSVPAQIRENCSEDDIEEALSQAETAARRGVTVDVREVAAA